MLTFPPKFHRRLGVAGLLVAAVLLAVQSQGAQGGNANVRVNPYEKKPFTFKEPVPQKPVRLCMWREAGAVGYCPVGPATPIGASCECVQTIEHKVTRHRGTVIAQQ